MFYLPLRSATTLQRESQNLAAQKMDVSRMGAHATWKPRTGAPKPFEKQSALFTMSKLVQCFGVLLPCLHHRRLRIAGRIVEGRGSTAIPPWLGFVTRLLLVGGGGGGRVEEFRGRQMEETPSKHWRTLC